MRNKLFLVGLLFSLAALIFFLYRQKDATGFIETPTDKVSQQQQSLGVPQAGTDISVQAEKLAAGQSDFFLGDISFVDVKSRAEAGDLAAQRQLSEMYEDCMFYSIGSERYLNGLDQLYNVKPRPKSKPFLEKIKAQTRNFCDTVDGGQVIPPEAYKLWLKQSADNGDLISSIRINTRSANEVSATEFESYLDKVSKSANPIAMFEFATMVGMRHQESSNEKYNPVLYGEYAQHAWEIAACRNGMDCSNNSRLMRQVCTSFMICHYANYEQFLYSEMLPQGAKEEIERRISLINSEITKTRK